MKKNKLNKNKKYLFICGYGQSRSRYFAERLMELGIKALFCGHCKEADVLLNKELIEWSDIIIILDKDFYRNIQLTDLIDYYDKDIITNFINDEPSEFNKLFNDLFEKYNPFDELLGNIENKMNQNFINGRGSNITRWQMEFELDKIGYYKKYE